jgi:hypothetical protein
MRITLVALLIGGTACGPLQHEGHGRAFAVALSEIVLNTDDLVQTDTVMPLSRAQIDAYPRDLMLIDVILRDATAYVFLGAVNGSKTTWMSEDGLSMTFEHGVLIGTRGFGFDMMAAEVSGTLTGFSGASSYSRTYDFLDGLNQIRRPIFKCQTTEVREEIIEIADRSYAVTVFEELCVGETNTFTNIYRKDTNGTIRQSRQWVSPDLGYIRYHVL